MRYSNHPIYKRRRQMVLLVLVLLLVVLTLGSIRAGGTDGERMEQVDAPIVDQAPEIIDEQTVAE